LTVPPVGKPAFESRIRLVAVAIGVTGAGPTAWIGLIGVIATVAGYWSRVASHDCTLIRGGSHDVSIRMAVARDRGASLRRKRSMMTRRPPQHGQAASEDAIVAGSGSLGGDAGASRRRIPAMVAAREPLANRP
jgi:hypothetical protein